MKVGEIYSNKHWDEIIEITSVLRSDSSNKVLLGFFINKEIVTKMNFKNKKIRGYGADRLPIILPEDLKKDYTKIGVL